MFLVFLPLLIKKNFLYHFEKNLQKENLLVNYDASSHSEKRTIKSSQVLVSSIKNLYFRSKKVNAKYLFVTFNSKQNFISQFQMVQQQLNHPGIFILGLFFSSYIVRPQALEKFYTQIKTICNPLDVRLTLLFFSSTTKIVSFFIIRFD